MSITATGPRSAPGKSPRRLIRRRGSRLCSLFIGEMNELAGGRDFRCLFNRGKDCAIESKFARRRVVLECLMLVVGGLFSAGVLFLGAVVRMSACFD